MPGNAKQQFKQFNIDCIQNACIALGTLITGAIVHYKKYKEYADEADELLECSNTEYVTAKDYDDINDKLLYRQHEILKLLADHQPSSFSYKDLRKQLERKGYLTTPLSNDITSILSEMLDIRNWTFHNPQSMIVAAKEAAERSIPPELQGVATIIPQLNPLIVATIDRYELLMLASLTVHTRKRITQFEAVINSMKADYQEMYSSIDDKPFLMTDKGFSDEVQYIERRITSQLSGYQSDIAQISMAIHKSKYDGTDQAFKKWILRLDDSSTDEE